MCVRSCPDLVPNYFGDPADRVCKPCRSNCNKCTGWNGCTECSNYNVTETQTKPDGSTVQVVVSKKLLNAEGICVQTCPSNSIDNSTFFMCHMCPVECTTCSEISSNCTACNLELGTSLYTYMNKATPPKQEGRCLKKCPNGYFSDTGICKMCDESCTACE